MARTNTLARLAELLPLVRRCRRARWTLACAAAAVGACVTAGHPTSSVAAEVTQIDGEFDGCDYDKAYGLRNGALLVCREYTYFYTYAPEVIVLDSSTVLIDRNKVSASIEPGRIIKTAVAGTFEGCDYDRMIELENGLLFKCSTYRYQYAYRPTVRIVLRQGGQDVYIAGQKYSGTLYRR